MIEALTGAKPIQRLAISMIAVLLLPSCGGGGSTGGSNPVPSDFDRNALLQSYSNRIVLPTVRDFAEAAAALAATTTALEIATAAASTAATERAAAHQAWRAAMRLWQRAEVLQVGPTGSPSMTMGGQGLRDEIYSWPAINPCRVDQETVSADFNSPDFFTRELVNTRGLAAIEYLLFDGDDTNACAASVDINANGSWAALRSSGEIPKRRAAYAARASAEVNRRAIELRDAWEPSGGNFAAQLANAGLDGSIYDTAQEAVDAVFAALFYIELQVKDRKLAVPAGLDPECPDSVCIDQQESRFADASREHILANLQVAERVFLGSGPSDVGFDEFLRELGAGELADQMTTNLALAIYSAEAIPGTFTSALMTDPDSVRAAYTTLKTFTDDLKSQFVTVLNLTIPREGAGDND